MQQHVFQMRGQCCLHGLPQWLGLQSSKHNAARNMESEQNKELCSTSLPIVQDAIALNVHHEARVLSHNELQRMQPCIQNTYRCAGRVTQR